MAEFAKAQLLKYGWTEGKGLGKRENGITKALKPNLKLDTFGVGHKSTESDDWWTAMFNRAAKNISSVSEIDKQDERPKNIAQSKKVKYKLEYTNFCKTSTLHNGSLIDENKFDKRNHFNVALTDEELFKACGGRTGHKGARHGLTLNGKLERIARQERELLGSSSKKETLLSTELSNNTYDISEDLERNSSYEMDSNANAVLDLIPSFDFKNTSMMTPFEQRKISRDLDTVDVKHNISTSKLYKIKRTIKKKRNRDRKLAIMFESSFNHSSEVTKEIHDISLSNSRTVRKHKSKKTKTETCSRDNVQKDEHVLESDKKELISTFISYGARKSKKKAFVRSSVTIRKSQRLVIMDLADRLNTFCLNDKSDKTNSSIIKHSSASEANDQSQQCDAVNSKHNCNTNKVYHFNSNSAEKTTQESQQVVADSKDNLSMNEADYLNWKTGKKKKHQYHRRQKVKLEKITNILNTIQLDSEKNSSLT